MKNISTILSVVALIAVGVLYWLDFSGNKKLEKQINTQTAKNNRDTAVVRIAYFDIDSLQTHYQYFKDAENQMSERENTMSAQLNDLDARNQRKIKEWNTKKATMTQAGYDAAMQEYAQMQRTFEQTKYTLQQSLQKDQMELMTDLRKKVEDFLIEYNKQKGYTFILAYQPNNLIYYRDSTNDITDDLIEGLNARYKATKKK